MRRACIISIAMASPQFLYEPQAQPPAQISRRPESSSANVENVEKKLRQSGKASVIFSTFILIFGIIEASLSSTFEILTYGQAIWCSIINIFAGTIAILCGKNPENKSKAKSSILFSFVGIAFSCILLIIQLIFFSRAFVYGNSIFSPFEIFMFSVVIMFGILNLLVMSTSAKFSHDVYNKQNSNNQQVIEDQVVQRSPYSIPQDNTTATQQGVSLQHNNPSSVQNYQQFSQMNQSFSQINLSFAYDNPSLLQNEPQPPRYEDIKF